MKQYAHHSTKAFTLLELSIVLVVIGLLVGGVLMGKDLIDSAKVRSQISQIEQYQTAVAAFKLKYNCMPGDCKDAGQFGFPPRGNTYGTGDGNGLLQATRVDGVTGAPDLVGGETGLFWVDLSLAGLVMDTFNTAQYLPPGVGYTTVDTIKRFMPLAKYGSSNFVSAYATTLGQSGTMTSPLANYFSVCALSYVGENGTICTPNIKVIHAYSYDTKVDDGNPLSGRVQTYKTFSGTVENVNLGNATPGSATTCADNRNGTGSWQYSITTNSGENATCSITIKFSQ